jgi:hypothetical protein
MSTNMTDILLMVIVCTLLVGAAAVRTALAYLAGLAVELREWGCLDDDRQPLWRERG